MKRHWTAVPLLVSLSILAAAPPLPAQNSLSGSVPLADRPALDVPYVPTPEEVVNEMLNVAAVNGKDILYDLGCGDGRIVITAAKERNVKRAVGVDLDPQRIEQSKENARAAGVSERVAFQQKDLFAVDIREATVVSLYLLPTINLKLRPKLLRELKPGTRIVSHDFTMGDWQPDREVQLNEHTIYYWVVPARVSGVWRWTVPGTRRQQRYSLVLKQHFQNVYRAELKINGVETPVKNIRLTGKVLEFTVEDGKGPVRFSGTVSGDTMTGSVSEMNNAPDKKWTAHRKPAREIPVDASSADKVKT